MTCSPLFSQLCISNITMTASNQPWGTYLHHGNWPILLSRALPTFHPTLESLLLRIYQYTTAVAVFILQPVLTYPEESIWGCFPNVSMCLHWSMLWPQPQPMASGLTKKCPLVDKISSPAGRNSFFSQPKLNFLQC